MGGGGREDEETGDNVPLILTNVVNGSHPRRDKRRERHRGTMLKDSFESPVDRISLPKIIHFLPYPIEPVNSLTLQIP